MSDIVLLLIILKKIIINSYDNEINKESRLLRDDKLLKGDISDILFSLNINNNIINFQIIN